jgi:hypothetical protein
MVSQKRQKFVGLAEKRVTRTIKDLRLIGNLSNRSNYEYDEADVRRILRALKNEVTELERRFESPGRVEDVIFKLDN